MGIQRCELNLNQERKELRPHGTSAFPCAAYWKEYFDTPEQIISWHWHEELEIIYINSGNLELQIPSKIYHLTTGDCMIINSNILHYAAAKPRCDLQSLVFHPMLITGTNDSVFAVKYLHPLLSQTAFDAYLLKKDTDAMKIDHFINAFEALVNDTPGFEFTVRENLTSICYFLYLQFEHEITKKETIPNQDHLRIQKMLDYIHMHFSGSITLSDIAKTAAIGERECLRCFQRTIHLSPIQYLLKYRIMQGANILLEHPSRTISEVAALCGFDSPSNFSKMFKRFYNCTPRQYRSLK